VILIGEIRHKETMEHAIAFAETGHLAMGTLQGLILSKVVLLAAAAAAVRYQRMRAIRSANIVFCAIVLWNTSVIVRLALASH